MNGILLTVALAAALPGDRIRVAECDVVVLNVVGENFEQLVFWNRTTEFGLRVDDWCTWPEDIFVVSCRQTGRAIVHFEHCGDTWRIACRRFEILRTDYDIERADSREWPLHQRTRLFDRTTGRYLR